jgi:hypothetical protein
LTRWFLRRNLQGRPREVRSKAGAAAISTLFEGCSLLRSGGARFAANVGSGLRPEKKKMLRPANPHRAARDRAISGGMVVPLPSAAADDRDEAGAAVKGMTIGVGLSAVLWLLLGLLLAS